MGSLFLIYLRREHCFIISLLYYFILKITKNLEKISRFFAMLNSKLNVLHGRILSFLIPRYPRKKDSDPRLFSTTHLCGPV